MDSTASKLLDPPASFGQYLVNGLYAHVVAAIPCYLFFSIRNYPVMDNLVAFTVVYVATSILLTLAYRGLSAFFTVKYARSEDVLSSAISEADRSKRINKLLRKAAVNTYACANVIFLAASILLSTDTVIGRFNFTTGYTLAMMLPATVLAYGAAALL